MKTIANKNMVWIATANLIYPNTSPTHLVSSDSIKKEIARLFGNSDNKITTAFQISRHLVSWQDKDADKNNPRQGGDRSRFLFQTLNGQQPAANGKYRLYKRIDGRHDGKEKTGTTHPLKSAIPTSFHALVDWYVQTYY